MAQHYVKFALCLLLVAVTKAGVLKSRQISLPPGAIVMDVAIKQNINGTDKTIATMKLDLDGDNRKVTLFDAVPEIPPANVVEIEKNEDLVPTLEDRNIFPRGYCPLGYVRRGSVCFPDDDQ